MILLTVKVFTVIWISGRSFAADSVNENKKTRFLCREIVKQCGLGLFKKLEREVNLDFGLDTAPVSSDVDQHDGVLLAHVFLNYRRMEC